MKSITINLETITPMFLGGADGKSAELRPPSIKGLMRFWWRAIKASQNQNIDTLQEKENAIFGGAGEHATKSTFSIKVDFNNIKPTKNDFPKHNISVTSKGRTFPINPLEYLAYGTYKYERGSGNIFIRDYFPSNTKFDVTIIVKEESNTQDILLPFYFFSAFSGLGSRSRNGFGGFNILNREEVFSELGKDYIDNIIPTKEMLKPFIFSSNTPSYTAFSNGAKLFKGRQNFTTWDSALADVGKIYKAARESLEDRHTYNARQYIGAPLDPPRESFKSLLDRHLKPYFIKIVKLSNTVFIPYILYLPSKYCDGLDEDRNKKPINHKEQNQKFETVCNKFNEYLVSNMEVLL